MFDFTYTDEQLALKETAAQIARDRYAPMVLEWDENFTFFPKEEKKYLAELGFMGICLPEEHGGAGADLIDALIVIEEIAKECQLAAFYVFEANTGPARVIDLFGTEEQKAKFLPPIIEGEKVMAVAISEPDAGSAATDMTTIARRDGDEWVINGMKRWSSGWRQAAEQYLVYCRLNDELGARAIGAIVVDDGTWRVCRTGSRSSSWASTASRPRTSSSTTSGYPPRTSSSRRAASDDSSRPSRSSGSATPP